MASRREKRRTTLPDPGLPDQLRAAILDAGISAGEVARRAGVDPTNVHRFLSGERDIRLETAGLIARAIGYRLTPISRGRGRPTARETGRADFPGSASE